MILPANRGQRLLHMQDPRLAEVVFPAPVVDPVGRVGVLLDLQDHIAGPDRVNPARWQKHRRTGFGFEPVETVRHRACLQCLFELGLSHSILESGQDFRLGRGLEKKPHLRFRLTGQLLGPLRRRVDLQGKLVLRVQQLDQDRESLCIRRLDAKNLFSVRPAPQIVQRLARLLFVRLRLRPVGQLPSLPDLFSLRQRASKSLGQISSAPNSLLRKRLKLPDRHRGNLAC